jgi:hypothetical protein
MSGSGVAVGARDFRVEPLLRWVTVVEAVVLAVGGLGLLFVPDLIRPFWPWQSSPFTERALGAVYTSAFIVALALAIRSWWSPARIVVPMVAMFTTIVAVLSVLGIERLTNWPWTGVWLIVYLTAAAIALWYVWRYRGMPPAPSARPPGRLLRGALLAEIVVFGGYGVLLLALGSTAARFWPWAVGGIYSDDFVARIYSAAFLAPATGAALLVRAGTRFEDRTLGVTQVVSGVAAIAGLLVVDAGLHRVDWGSLGSWLWVALCVAIAAVGLLLLRGRPAMPHGQSRPRP